MDGVSSSKVAGAAHQGDAEAAQDAKNKSTKGDVEGLSDSRPQTPPADPNSVQGEAKKMAELSIKEQEVEQPASTAEDQAAAADDKPTDSSVDKEGATKSDDAEKTDMAGDTGKSEVGEQTAQNAQPASSEASEAPDEGSKPDSPDSSPAEESVTVDAEAKGGSSAEAQSQQGAEA